MEIDCKLTRLFHLNQSTEQPWHSIYIGLYVCFTIASFTCNALLLLSLYLQSKTRRPRGTTNTNTEKTRDILVAHLAAFDLLLSITMPFTALDALSKYWPLGPDTVIICRLVKSIPSVAVYSSSMIIVTIAVNCCHQILCHSRQQLKPQHLKHITPIIVIISIVMSSPIFYYAKLYYIIDPTPFNESTTLHDIGNTSYEMTTSFHLTKLPMEGNADNESFPVIPTSSMDEIRNFMNDTIEDTSLECNEDEKFDDEDWFHVLYCIEDWPFDEGPTEASPMDRVYYSLFSLIFQLIIPGIVISVSYFLIYQKLRHQSLSRQRMMSENRNTERIERENQRSKRRNKMLAIMSLIFLISWLPLSIIGVLLDSQPDILGTDIELVTIVFMTCHLIGMSSAFANPIIYGYSNKNIRKGNYHSLFLNKMVSLKTKL